MEIKCLIVDDEILAQDVIEKYILATPTLKLAGKCDNAIEAITFLHNNKVDLMFLDLNMPEMGGLEMLKTLSRPPKVIFTTAYSEYALESYEYGAVDYLLKPIKFERFMKAINKLVEQFTVSMQEVSSQDDDNSSIFIKEDQITYQLKTATILYIEAYGNYLKVHTPDKTYVIRETMHEMQNLLPEKEFIRVHKSYIVSLAHIESIMGNRISIKGEEIPVGEIYKLSLKERINK
ncbi:MAG: LytTR family DNA-binding domain-containing protein [Bacteroidales bacterium]|nr:LytTR family DNA-binding domain-containing protein [Bacteroidales bacterium]